MLLIYAELISTKSVYNKPRLTSFTHLRVVQIAFDNYVLKPLAILFMPVFWRPIRGTGTLSGLLKHDIISYLCYMGNQYQFNELEGRK